MQLAVKETVKPTSPQKRSQPTRPDAERSHARHREYEYICCDAIMTFFESPAAKGSSGPSKCVRQRAGTFARDETCKWP